jgi:glycosyltransferase involved in cell wall biosynthesis
MVNTTIIIIAPNIKGGGGRELLEYLLEYLEDKYKDIKVIVFLDDSLSFIMKTQNRQVVILDNVIDKVKLFYKKFDNALYFGNLPPLRKSHNSIVYFHNPYLLMKWNKLILSSIRIFIKYVLQQVYLHIYMKNVDIVACQNQIIKDKFIKKYSNNIVEVLPFFRLCVKKERDLTNNLYDFCYVSLAHPHKNHTVLFKAMNILSNKGISVSLAVTIENDKNELINEIRNINSLGFVKIDNLGVISKKEVCQLYSKSKCLIFPSKEETFGLGLIEAVDMGLDIIAADLDYVYQVVNPSMVFDPESAKMCAEVIVQYLKGKNKKSIGLINNKIDKLIDKLIKDNIYVL